MLSLSLKEVRKHKVAEDNTAESQNKYETPIWFPMKVAHNSDKDPREKPAVSLKRDSSLNGEGNIHIRRKKIHKYQYPMNIRMESTRPLFFYAFHKDTASQNHIRW